MDEKLVAALIAGVVSLLVSLLTYWATERRIRHDRSSTARQIAQRFAEELLKHRLRLYPGAFVATTNLGKGSADDASLPEKYRVALDELRKWKTGEVEVVISEEAEDRFHELVERLKRNPGRGSVYNKDQVGLIFQARQKFRGALRRDLGLMRSASRMRLQLPEDDA
jgi:hypothetical protein